MKVVEEITPLGLLGKCNVVLQMNTKPNTQAGDLARCQTQEANDDWPTLIEVVAYFGKEGRKGKRKSIEISADEFFGRGRYGAPISGEALVLRVNQLRKG